MAPYDILMIIVFAGAILFGLWKGLAWQVASLAALIVSYFVAIQFREPLTQLLGINQPWAPFLSMLILYLGSSLAIWIGYGYVRQTIQRMHLKEFDAHAGAVVGAFKGALLCMLITMFAVTLLGDNARRLIVQSRSGGFIARSINQLNSLVPSELHAMLDPFVNKFNTELAQPLPPADSNSSWLGKFLPGQGQPTPAPGPSEQFGNFARPQFSQSTSFEIAPGMKVNIDGQKAIENLSNGWNNTGTKR